MNFNINKATAGKLLIQNKDKYDEYNCLYTDEGITIICDDPKTLYEKIKKQKWINCISENHQLIFLVGKVSFQWGIFNSLKIIPDIILAGIINNDIISDFKELQFSGKLINIMYPANQIVDFKKDGKLQNMEFKDVEKVTLKKDIDIEDGFELKITISGSIKTNFVDIYDLSDIKSKVKLCFKKELHLDRMFKYIELFYQFFIFVSKCSNIEFAIHILTKFNQDNKQINTRYEVLKVFKNTNICDYDKNKFSIIPMKKIWCNIEILLKIFYNGDHSPYLNFLIDNNENLISGYNVIAICNSICREFDIKILTNENFLQFSTKYINSIKREDFSDNIKNKHIKYIKSKNKEKLEKVYLRIKIETLYKYYYDEITKVIKINHQNSSSPSKRNDFLNKLSKFIEIRNSAAHSIVKWNDGKIVYNYIELIIYLSILDRAGYDLKDFDAYLNDFL